MTSPVHGPANTNSRPTVKCKTCGKVIIARFPNSFLILTTLLVLQEFGRSSIKFHEPQCERKKVAEEMRRGREEEGEEKVSYIDHIGESENCEN